MQSHNSDMEEEEESSVSELTEAETVESPGEVADDAGLLKVSLLCSWTIFIQRVLYLFPPIVQTP